MVGFLMTLCLKDWLFETKGLEYTGYSMFGGRMCPTLAESPRTSIKTFPFKDINDSLMAVCCAHVLHIACMQQILGGFAETSQICARPCEGEMFV